MQRVPQQNFMEIPSEPHMEVLDVGSRQVWQSRHPVDRADYEAMSLEAPFIKVGLGRAAMDAHWFRRSPRATEDGPVEVRDFAGRAFAFCAMPEKDLGPTGDGGPRELFVDKHHSLLFRAGRAIDFLRLPDGDSLVHVIAARSGAEPLQLPERWVRETAELHDDLTVDLPCPTRVFFFPNGDSFQGPVAFPDGS